MCKHGTIKKINVIRRANPSVSDGRHEISVDSCIADRVQGLNNKGIITVGCCCGHGKAKGNILFDSKFKEQMEKEGYVVEEFTSEHTEAGILVAYLSESANPTN